MKIKLAIATIAVVVPVLITGCSSNTNPTESASTTTAKSIDIRPADATTSRSVPPTSVAPAPAPDIAGKVVVRGDASSCTNDDLAAPVSLISTSTELGVAGYAGNALRVTWEYAGELPATGTVLFSLTAANEPGTVTKQLGYKTLGGKQIGYFVFDMSGKQLNLSGFADTRSPGQISAVMPSAAVDALGQEWHWSSSLNIDGQDVDACPS